MIVSREFEANCAGCHNRIQLFEYQGLEGGIYGSHTCQPLQDLMCSEDMEAELFYGKREVRSEFPLTA